MKISVLIILIIVLTLAIVGNVMTDKNSTVHPWHNLDSEKIKTEWAKVSANKTIYFGHQSVGANIASGFKDLGIQSNIKDLYVGNNRDPLSKITDFERQLNGSIDIAMLKFCFVDITSDGVPVDTVFDEYMKMVMRVELEYPNIKLVHMTVPLTSGPASLKRKSKDIIKRIIGKPTYDFSNNEARTRFNKLITDTYGSHHMVFDIAQYESLYGQYTEKGYPALLPEYTYDGGHLNEVGRQGMALLLLNTLINSQ